jgi:PTH1 family peptidyl-tRNA hydrolase
MWLFSWFKKKEKTVDPMKYLIVGLGNMGAEYDDTRHNIGFAVVDHLALEKGSTWKHENLGDIAKVKHKGRTLILLKPSTFMNRSGKSVRYWLQKENINLENLLVLTDDLNLDFGKLRMKPKGSDGGHNGIKDVNDLLGSNYTRLRIGIGNAFSQGGQVDFVLGKWSSEEKKELKPLIEKAAESALSFCAIGVQHTMNQFNN